MRNKIISMLLLLLVLGLFCSCGEKENQNAEQSVTEAQTMTEATVYTESETQTQTEPQTLPQQAQTTAPTEKNNTNNVSVYGTYKPDYHVNINTSQTGYDMTAVFGTGYKMSGQNVVFNEDDTFCINTGIYKSEDDVTGTFSVSQDGKYISAKYNNGTQKQFQISRSDDGTSYVVITFEDFAVYFLKV